jgi:predicted nucleic acid-binding protein
VRVVLDTNVAASGFLGDAVPRQLLYAAREQAAEKLVFQQPAVRHRDVPPFFEHVSV